ncbi:MAG: lipoprotein signal peptidase [Bacteroidia bacterium]
MKFSRYIIFALVLVLVDQGFKLWIHSSMALGETQSIMGDWFKLHYILNPGIAFGLKLDFEYGKLLLSLVRLLAVVGLGWYTWSLFKKGAHRGLIATLALIWAGAFGNTIDSVFYGVLIDGNAMAGSFTPWFHGQVIDMLYFPMIESHFPSWFPFWGGERFTFFSPVFNIADACISVGFFVLLIFQGRFFPKEAPKEKEEDTSEESTSTEPAPTETDETPSA